MSLLELLVVMAIIGLLAVLVVPSAGVLTRGTSVTQAADNVEATLRLARQYAKARNRQIECRFYKYVNPEMPGSPPSAFLGIQIFLIDEGGVAEPLGKLQRLPKGILLDSSQTLSPLLSDARLAMSWTAAIPQPSLPRIGTSYGCQAFRFRPNGSTNLPPDTNWFFTLNGISDGDNLSEPPANYATIQIDPISGSLTTYRP